MEPEELGDRIHLQELEAAAQDSPWEYDGPVADEAGVDLWEVYTVVESCFLGCSSVVVELPELRDS